MSPFTGKMEILFCGKIYFKTKNLAFRFFPEQNNSLGKKICGDYFRFLLQLTRPKKSLQISG